VTARTLTPYLANLMVEALGASFFLEIMKRAYRWRGDRPVTAQNLHHPVSMLVLLSLIMSGIKRRKPLIDENK